jgi:ferredoxin
VNHAFTLKLASSGKALAVPADKTAADVLWENGVHVDLKCSDGLCGLCKCAVIAGEVEHREFVLPKAQRAGAMILCQSRAAKDGGVIEIDLYAQGPFMVFPPLPHLLSSRGQMQVR